MSPQSQTIFIIAKILNFKKSQRFSPHSFFIWEIGDIYEKRPARKTEEKARRKKPQVHPETGLKKQ